MREILFRGKRTDNGEWVEGYYYKAKYCRTDDELCDYITVPHPIGKIKDIATLDFCPECLKAFDAFMNPLRKEVKDNG